MKQIKSLHGILGLLYIMLSIVFIVLAKLSPGVVDAFSIYWMFTLAALILGIIILIHPNGITVATYISRIFTGSLFIVSGLIKSNDPLGFSYKLEEYFDERSLGAFFASFHEVALPLAIIISSAEVLLGLAVLVGGKAKITHWILLAMTLFFAWLTWFTASCNDAQQEALNAGISFNKLCVNDCGCFGDALKGSVGRSLTPWESFYKDITLLFFVLVLLLQSKKIKLNTLKDDLIILPVSLILIVAFSGGLFHWDFPSYFTLVSLLIYAIIKLLPLINAYKEWLTAIVLGSVCIIFTTYCLKNLPIKDFRPYAVGKNILQQMKLPEGAQPDVYETLLTYKNTQTGEIKEFTQQSYPWDDSTWVWVSTNNKLIKQGDKATITDFTIIADDGNDYAEDYLSDTEPVFMLIVYNVSKTNKAAFEKINKLANDCNSEGKTFIALTASGYEEVEKLRHDTQAMYDFYTCDEITLKTIIRSNPGLLLLKEGTVLAKWNDANIPDYKTVKEKYLNNN
ncbi:hypothetical protein FLAV_02106 [Flavobacteriales bacterium]|nr:hypothetical protein [Flavobacteriales bacterium]MCL4817072.1 DoxX family protein [Flavobacteriales bacterium]WKZ76064.1 MAG: DoxX family protein [Vicingaceae bacterium]GIK70501.1 MAG: hypothetical protein BroJett020_17960 [Bacteroidota bacterium]CAG0987248.1 hypothetical protein FLAV_02106 [Flavobacteriales bacterium]